LASRNCDFRLARVRGGTRKLAPLLLAACGGSQTAVPPADSGAAPLGIQWGTPGDDEAFALIPARSGGLFVAGYSAGTDACT
jgi:hypothetical protein